MITNLASKKLHKKCDGTHTHIRIEGRYTKASAVYTDGLAIALAECISCGLRRKKAYEAYNETSTDGLESVSFNDFLLSSEWKVEDEWTWQTPSHINIHETASIFRLLKTEATHRPRQRFPVGVDSHVALSALAKGRSPSFGLRPVLRRSASVCIAGCLYPAYLFAPTRFNPGDCPTRNVAVPAPSCHGFVTGLDFQTLLKLNSASGLKRHLANWARLFLILLGGRLPWWSWKDSVRFGHYEKSTYPFALNSSPEVVLGFDKTLGFPGEGPIWIWFLFVLLSEPSYVSPFGLSLCFDFSLDAAGRCSCCLLCLDRPCQVSRFGTLRQSFLVAAMPTVDSHGSLEPRDRGDIRRASGRQQIFLVEGRAVQPKTKDAREGLLARFDEWLHQTGDSLACLVDTPEVDIDRLNSVLELYGRELFRAGRPYNHFAETLNAISSRRPRLRKNLQQAWNLAMTWLREEPGSHHVALPWQGIVAVISTAFCWGWIQVAGILALSWGGVTRIGEAVSASRADLLLPSDFGWTINYVLLQISEPKTRFRAARHQVARLDQPQLVQVVELAFRNFSKADFLWPHSGQTLRLRFNKILSVLGLAGGLPGAPRGLDLGSLRAGGATWLLQTTEDSELVRRRGRWLNARTMEIYIQESSALQFLPSLPESTRKLLLNAISIFPLVLAKFVAFDKSGIPSSAWRLLLLG